jgi:outer membrane protein OmpA-like peptidoglycan-associated protein
MSEQNNADKAVTVDEIEETGGEPVHPEPSTAPVAQKAAGKPPMQLSPVMLLLFMILALITILIVISIGRNGGSGDGVRSDDPAVAALKADLDARRSELNRQRMALGLAPLVGGSEPIEDIAKRLKTDADTLVGVSSRFQQMLSEKDAELSSRNGELLRSERLRQDVSMENSRLQSELARVSSAAYETERLKTMLADSQAQRDALAKELNDTRVKLVEMGEYVSGDEYADLKRRYEEALRAKDFFEARVKVLEADIGKAELFAKSENELLPAAVELFRRLRKLEDQKDSDLTTEYSKLGVDLGANVLHALSFKTGSDELSAEDMAQLSQIANDEVPDGDLTLIVGYASETGDAAKNQTLSSDRATAAAEYFASQKRPGQLVQAVYLGQTNRFSGRTPERNQICEVWRIRRK